MKQLFLRTLDDIAARVVSNDPYVLLGLSGLIRKLFLDDAPLVDQVNKTHRLKIRFSISDPNSPYTQLVLSHNPAFYSVQDGLDPDTNIGGHRVIEVNRDEFFRTRVLIAGGRTYSLREIILFEANIMGGVHAGRPTTEQERALAAMDALFTVGGHRAALRQLQSIARIVLKELQPLREAVQNAA